MTAEQNKTSLIEDLEKARDLNINQFNRPDLAQRWQSWIDQINANKITDVDLWIWLDHQINYYGEKDRSYAKWLQSLIDEGIK
jgi:hypothetical protein